MDKIFGSVSQYPSKRRDYKQFSGFQCGRDNSLAEFCQIVFIGSSDLFDKTVYPKTLDHASDLMCRFADKMFSQPAVTHTADVEFAACNGIEQIQIIAVKKIEASIASAVVADGLGNFFDVFMGRAWIVYGRNKIDIAAVGCTRQFGKHIQTVNAFLQGRKLHFTCAIPMFHPAVVFKKGNVIDGCFDSQHKAVLVIHFYCHRPHVMLDACSLYAGVKVIAHLVLIISVKVSSQKCCDVVCFDSMYGRSDQFIIDGSKIALLLENNVGGVFGLHDAPVAAILKKSDYRTVHAGISVEYPVNVFDIEVIGQFLRLVEIFDAYKTIVEHDRLDAFFSQLSRQLVMAVEIELEAKRRPCRHSQVTQAKNGVDEIKVVMQTFAAVILEKRFVGIFVMPGLITGAWFHGREYVHKSGIRTALGNNLLNALFLAKVLFADEVYGKSVLGGNRFCVLSYLFPQRQCPLGIVENTDALLLQKQCHSVCITNAGDGTGQNDTVKTGNDALNFVMVSFNKVLHAQYLKYNCIGQLSEKYRAA